MELSEITQEIQTRNILLEEEEEQVEKTFVVKLFPMDENLKEVQVSLIDLTKEDKRHNRRIASERVINENIIGKLKRFKIIADKYRNRRKRFGLRFNLIAGLYNWDLKS